MPVTQLGWRGRAQSRCGLGGMPLVRWAAVPFGSDPHSSALGDRTVVLQHYPGYYSTTRGTTVRPGLVLSLWRYAIGDYY